MPELTTNKKISLLSLAQREKRNLELQEAQKKTEWLHRTGKILKEHIEKIKYISTQLKILQNRKEKEEEAFLRVADHFENIKCKKINEEDTGKYYILGWMFCKYSHMVLLLDIEDMGNHKIIFANSKIEKILKHFKPSFLQRETKKKTVLNFYKPTYNDNDNDNYFILEIQGKQRFLKNSRWLEYFPVFIDPRERNLREEIAKILKEEEDLNEKTENFYLER